MSGPTEPVPALANVRVLDLTEWVAGPYASMLLAGLGADVIKVERPGGDPARRLPPFAPGAAAPEASLLFLHLNRAKRSVVLDPAAGGDRARLAAFAADADLLLLDAHAGALAAWGLDAAALRASHPDLVIVALPSFAAGDERADWCGPELVMAAASGLASCTGDTDREPLKPGGHICLVAHGQTAAAAATSALLGVRRGGPGAVIEVAASDACADLLEMWACGAYRDRPMPRQGRFHNSNYPFEVYPCRDGYVGVHAQPGAWADFVDLVGAPELADPALEDAAGRMRFRARIDPVLVRWLATKDRVETYHEGQARRFAFGYVATVADLMASPQLTAREFFRTIDHPSAPGARYPGAPFRLASGWRDGRAPLLDEHAGAGWARARGHATSNGGGAGGDASRPLAGIRVLDLSQIWAGPRATKVLADYGADVIKIEAPRRTDGTRAYGRFLADRAAGTIASERDHNRRTQFDQLHRGQRSVVLDLRSEEGLAAFRALARESDVVLANFASGVIDRLGIGWGELHAINSRLVLISMTSFGDSGPEHEYVAYGVTQEELCGLYAMNGYQGEGPLKTGSNVGDPMNGMHGAVAVIAALVERERTGRGQYIELSQLESSVPFIGEVVLDYAVNGVVAGPAGNTHPAWAPHGVFRARGEGAWIALLARDDAEWRALTRVLGARAFAADARFATAAGRLEQREALDALLAPLVADRDASALASELQAAGVPASPALNSVDVDRHPGNAASGYVQVMTHPDGGAYRYFGPLWTVDGRRPALHRPAPLLGEHQQEVLTGVAGLAAERVPAVS